MLNRNLSNKGGEIFVEINEVIERLRDLPPGGIYTIAPKHHVTRGYEYYRLGCLIGFVWSKDRQVLRAKVKGSRLYSVFITVSNGGLNYECNCPAWTPVTHCKHVVCVLITIKNILNPNLFNINKMGKEYKDALVSQLMPPSVPLTPVKEPDKETVKDLSIIITRQYPYGLLNISLSKNDVIAGYSSYYVPAELQWIVRNSYYYLRLEERFIEYLESYGNTYPLILTIDKRDIPIEWNGDITFSSHIHLDATKKRVKLKRVFHEGTNLCKSPYLIGNRLILDIKTGRLGLLQKKKGWKLWKLWLDQVYSSSLSYNYKGLSSKDGLTSSIKIPTKEYQREPFIVHEEQTKDLAEMVLTVNDREVSPERGRHDYSVSIEMDGYKGEAMVSLKVWCELDGVRTDTTRDFFSYLHFFGNAWGMSAALRAKKRRRVMIDTFIMLLSAKNKEEAKRIIKESLANEDFRKRKIKSEARGLLMNAFAHLHNRSLRLQFSSGKWWLSRNEKDEEKIPYIILYDLFGNEIFMNMRENNEIIIPAHRLYERLSILSLRLKENNISLSFNDMPVRLTAIEACIDLDRAGDINWFELKPEIRCGGEVISEKEWRRIIDNSGVLKRNGTIEILDSRSREVLKVIASIYRPKRSERDKKRDIVRIPRLRILDWIGLRNQGVTVSLPDEDEKVIERLTRFKKIEENPIPSSLQSILRDYQKEAYYWLSFLYEHGFGACLADDMGLGKTLQAISLLAGIKEEKVKPYKGHKYPHLIVVPPSLLFNWENEIRRFYPELKVHLYIGTERKLDTDVYDIVLTTYGIVRRDIERLKERQFNIIVFDEAQTVKNIYADTTSAVRQLKGEFKLTMTGTPLENHLGEYYSILDLALPGLLGDYEDFKPLISSSKNVERPKAFLPSLDIILNRTRPFLLRRTKEEILKELPPKMETDIYLEPTEKQKAIYRRTVEMVRKTIDKAYTEKTKAQAQIIALTAILRLRQICVSPRLLDPTISETSPKIVFLIERLKELIDEGHGALVFSQFTSFLDILEEDMRQEGLPFLRLDGSTPTGKRKGLVESFQNGNGPSIFLLSLKAGGQGLNLTRASYVFHLDPWWNPAVENQASDRTHRIGQKNKVSIFRLLIRHTIEEKMMMLKKRKLTLYKAVMDGSPGQNRRRSLTKADFDYLINPLRE